MFKSKNSLTFYQTLKPINSLIDSRDVNSSIFATTMQGEILSGVVYSTNSSVGTINNLLGTIKSYNAQFQTIYSTLNEARTNVEKELSNLLANNPSADSMRNIGVRQMWDYLKAEAQMGGNSSGFSAEQQQELIERGKVRYNEGHHINSVDAHPDLQANPDNVEPLEEHRYDNGPRDHLEAHSRNWRTQTEGPLLDRNQILEDANNQRVSKKQQEIKAERDNIIKNELVGIGAAIAIGFGAGFTIGFIASLAQNGLSAESFRTASIAGLKTGSTSALISVISYGITRTIGDVVTISLSNSISNFGIEITKNIAKMCSMGSIGFLSIVLYSTYQFVKLKRMGYTTKDSLIRVGKQATCSLMVLLVSILAQGIWGRHTGSIVTISIGLTFVTYNCVQTLLTKKSAEKLHLYAINKYYPVY